MNLAPSAAKKRRREEHRLHKSGCARTEGFYKIDRVEKLRTKYHFGRKQVETVESIVHSDMLPKAAKMQNISREARSNQRRLLNALGMDTDSDLLKFNQLKVQHIRNILFFVLS
jgi:[histone H3]-lysine4 N-trimethyltransferase SETD1